MKLITKCLLITLGCCFFSSCKHVGHGLAWMTGNCKDGVCALTSATEKEEAKKFSDQKFEKALKKIDTKELKSRLRSGAILLDARASKYTDDCIIPGANVVTIKTPKEDIFRKYPDKSALIITYCGDIYCPASLRLAMYLHNIGYTNLMEYPQGIDGWQKDGNKVIQFVKETRYKPEN